MRNASPKPDREPSSARSGQEFELGLRIRGQTVWRGRVEVFDLTGHPKAKRAYAWSHQEGKNNKGERLVAVLEIPPVESAKTAVQAAIMSDSTPKKG